jgi:2-methylcitrate dehydratase PrpD
MPRFVLEGQEGPMRTLCRMVVNTTYEDLPANVVNYAKRSILDTMGVIIGGSGLEAIPTVVDFVKNKGGKPQSIITFYGGKVPASEAAFALGPKIRKYSWTLIPLRQEVGTISAT